MLYYARLLVLFTVTQAALSFSAPTFGRYSGVLHHDNLKREQLAKLDFIVSKTEAGKIQLKAVLSLQFGDYKSGEYITYHYNNVEYDVLTGSLAFVDEDQPLSIFVSNFTGGELIGEVNSMWAGTIGKIRLSADRSIKPTEPLIEPVWGEYSGSCGDENVRLLLYTFRSTEDTAHVSQPFSSYAIFADLLKDCTDGQCVNFEFSRGSYNYFLNKDQLSLAGNNRTMRCTVGLGTLECSSPTLSNMNHCSLRRSKPVSLEYLSPVENRGVLPVFSPQAELPKEEFSNLVSGEYKGYVYHEYLGNYQAASLQLKVYRTPADLKVSAHAKLFFGDFSSSEFLPYKFPEKLYPNPLTGPQNFVLSRMDQNLDAVIQITEVKNGVIKGNWYSVIFGRVGPFEFRKDGLPELPLDAKKIERLSGVYEGPKVYLMPEYPKQKWEIGIQVMPGSKPAVTSENPFFPNLVRGFMIFTPLTPNLAVLDGSYDFYTGRLAFTEAKFEPLTGGSPASLTGPEHVWIGTQLSKDKLELHHWVGAALTRPLKQKSEVFQLVREFK